MASYCIPVGVDWAEFVATSIISVLIMPGQKEWILKAFMIGSGGWGGGRLGLCKMENADTIEKGL